MSRLHRSLLRLLPRDRRKRDEDEIVRVFAELRATASRRERTALWWKEIGGVVKFSFRERSAPVVAWFRDPMGGSMKALSNWKFLVVAPTVVGALVGLVVATKTPPRYRSEAVIVTVPSKVTGSSADPQATVASDDLLPGIRNRIFSRSRLERIIQDLDLYHAERASMPMEDVVEQFRSAMLVTMGPSGRGSSWIRVTYVGSDPKSVVRTTDRLASLFIEESTRDRKLVLEGTDQFLQARIKDTRQRLVEQQNALFKADNSRNVAETEVLHLELEVLRTQYKALLERQEASLDAVNLERREIGEQFRLVDAARIPSRAIGPTRLIVTAWGAAAGLGIGLLLVIGRALRRSHLLRAATTSQA